MKFILCSISLLVFSVTVFAGAEESPCPSTLFHYVYYGDNYEDYNIVALLLDRSADPNSSLENCDEIFQEEMQQYPQGTTLAHIAIDRARPTSLVPNGREAIFHLLKARGADTHIEDANGQTAESLYEAYIERVRLVLKRW